MSLGKAFSIVSLNTFISRIFGFFRDILMASILGASLISDAFFIALKLPNIFRKIFAEGALSIAFLPIYTEILHKEKETRADEFASITLSNLVVTLIPLCIICIALMPFILKILVPGYSDDLEQQIRTTFFARLSFPYLFFISLTALLGAILNSHQRFMAFSLASVFFNLCLIIALLLVYFLELDPFVGELLSISVVISGIVQCGFVYIWLRVEKIRIYITRPRMTPKIKRLFKLMGPGILGVITAQSQMFVDVMIASFLPYGSISYLYYADRLTQLPLGIIGAAMGTALLPFLSKAISQKDAHMSRLLFARSIEVCLALILPAAIALMIMPQILITFLFKRGAFDEVSVIATAQALAAYAIGLPAYILVKCLSIVFYGHQNTKTPVIITFCVMWLNIGLSIFLIQYILHVGIALSAGLTAWLSAALLAYYAHKKYGFAVEHHGMVRLIKLLAVNAVMAVLIYGFKQYAGMFDFSHFLKGSIVLIPFILGMILVYIGLLMSFGLFDLKQIRNILKIERVKKV